MGVCFANNLKFNNDPMGIHLSVSIWNKESFGLFNIKAPGHDLIHRHYHLTKSLTIYGDATNDQLYIQEQLLANKELEDLRTVCVNFKSKDNSGNTINAISNSFSQSRNLWVLCPSEVTGKDEPIKSGEVFRVGRQVIRFTSVSSDPQNQVKPSKEVHKYKNLQSVSALHTSPKISKENRVMNQLNSQNTNLSKNVPQTTVFCRICLEPETTDLPFEENLCACSRKMPAHVECIIAWMNRKCEKWNRNGVSFYDLALLFCDICKLKYPRSIKLNNVNRQILDIRFTKNTPYAIIESYENESEVVNGYYILEMAKDQDKKFFIGRHDQNQLTFRDISVSRLHAHISWHKNKLYLFDQESKFGTLKMISGKHNLENSDNKKFVMDKFMFCFHVFKAKNKCDCFHQNIKILKNPDDSLAIRVFIDLRNSVPDKPITENIESVFDVKEVGIGRSSLSQIKPFNEIKALSLQDASENELSESSISQDEFSGHSSVQSIINSRRDTATIDEPHLFQQQQNVLRAVNNYMDGLALNAIQEIENDVEVKDDKSIKRDYEEFDQIPQFDEMIDF